MTITNQLQQYSAGIPQVQSASTSAGVVPELKLSLTSKNLLVGSSSGVVIDSGLQIIDSDGGNLPAARVSISNKAATENLSIAGATAGQTSGTIGTVAGGGIINWNYDNTTGVISFTGTATNQVYQDALRSVTYSNTSTTPSTTPSSIQFTIGNQVTANGNGRYYEYVASGTTTWDIARTQAAGRNYFGLTGYLATITSSAENTLVTGIIKGNAWLGASDATTEGTWLWVTGPESGQNFYTGNVSNGYSSWLSGEPNNNSGNSPDSSENYAEMNFDIPGLTLGSWLDIAGSGQIDANSAYNSQGYVVEYGGFSTDPTTAFNVSGSVVINLTNQSPAIVGGNSITLRNNATGQNAIWQLSGATLSDSKLITSVADKNWALVSSADFNGDGKDDLLWRNYATGENAIWLKDGSNLDSFSTAGQKFITRVVDTDWKMITAADFNGDSKADILWRNNRTGENAIWFMDANSITSDNRYASNEQFFANSIRFIDTSWEMVGAGNFDADNKADIVWRNKATGENAIWLMDGTVGTPVASKAGGQKFITAIADSNWKIVGIGDFNKDNKSDLVWHNSSTGENAVWTVDTSVLTNSGNFFSTNEQFIKDQNGVNVVVQGSSWRIEAVGDTNNDGKSDLIWRNYANDNNAVWLMDGNISVASSRQTVTRNNATVLTGDLNWDIVDSYIA